MDYKIFSWLKRKVVAGVHGKAMPVYPKNGDKITLTWLPNPINNLTEKSAYIGMSGVVEDMKPDGSFVLNTPTSILIVRNNNYKWEYAKQTSPLTKDEMREREMLMELRKSRTRYFTQQEFDRLRYLSTKMFENAGSPHEPKK